jgi:integration host factor subunit beta
MSTVTKKELVDRIAEMTQTVHSTTKTIVQYFVAEIITELAKGNRLEFRDFGVFDVGTRAARTAQNPKTLERVQVPAKRAVKFKMGRLMKEKLNGQTPY